VNYTIEFEQEEDGRWIADIPALPGVMAYGATKQEARSNVQELAVRVLKS
jgi:predicted RNase H-like HicB family nuclease